MIRQQFNDGSQEYQVPNISSPLLSRHIPIHRRVLNTMEACIKYTQVNVYSSPQTAEYGCRIPSRPGTENRPYPPARALGSEYKHACCSLIGFISMGKLAVSLRASCRSLHLAVPRLFKPVTRAQRCTGGDKRHVFSNEMPASPWTGLG